MVLVVALMVRAWVAVSGNFYWDDLILVGRAGNFPLFSNDLLLYDHDGHFMPAAFVLAKAVTAIAPYDWTPAVVTLVLLQALAALAVFRLLRLLIGYRPILLAPLIFYLFSPLTLPSYSWWAAGLNSLPLQIGLAWVAGDAILLCRTGKRRYAVSGFAVFVIALLFFEKSVLVPFVAFGVVAAMYHVDAQANPLRRAWRGAKLLWLWSAGVTACWLVVYLVVVDQPFTVDGASKAVHLIERGLEPLVLESGDAAASAVACSIRELPTVARVVTTRPRVWLRPVRSARTGIGTDIHQWAPEDAPRPLWLGGIHWPGERGVAATSDGDVAAHAACNALLSAAGLGDLGAVFGVDRPEMADASGADMLREVLRLLTEAGVAVGNVAVQVVAPRPKVGTRRAEMEAALSAALGGAPVSVSAATTDRLGFIGRREGLVGIATALVVPAA